MHLSRAAFAVLALVALLMLAAPAVMLGQTSYATTTSTKVRAFQSGVQITDGNPGIIGMDTDCIGGIISADAVKMVCYLIPPGVSNSDNSNAIAILDTTTTIACPSDVGFSGDHTCFSVTFAGSLFDEGTSDNPADWHFHAEFYDALDNIIADGRQTFQNHSFFIIPESPIGMIALVAASLSGLGGFYLLRGHQNKQNIAST